MTDSADLPEIADPNEAEQRWLGEQLERASALALQYGHPITDEIHRLEVLDSVISSWYDDESPAADVNEMVNAVGVSFGDELAAANGLRWVVATDDLGSELALYREGGHVLVYPANLIAKRVVERRTGFLAPLFAELSAQINAVP